MHKSGDIMKDNCVIDWYDNFESLGLAKGVINRLKRVGIKDVRQLVDKTYVDLILTNGIACGTIEAVYDALKKNGLSLRKQITGVDTSFLKDLALIYIPGIDRVSLNLLRNNGFGTIGSLKSIPEERLVLILGEERTLNLLDNLEDVGFYCGKTKLHDYLRHKKESEAVVEKTENAFVDNFQNDFFKVADSIKQIRRTAGPQYSEACNEMLHGLANVLTIYVMEKEK